MNKYDRLFKIDTKLMDIYGFLITLKRRRKLKYDKDHLKSNINLKRIRKSDDCYIIGLGPSLKSIDLKKIKDDIIVTNRFYNITDAKYINPLLYVLVDNEYYSDIHREDLCKAISSFPDSNFVLNGIYSELCDKDFYEISKYYVYSWNGYFDAENDSIDCCKVLPASFNVVCTAIYVALYMGYKNIYLLGCDFNSFASTKKSHAYDEEDSSNRTITLSSELFQYAFSANLHEELNKYALKNGQHIINATNGSLIDAYKRAELTNLVKTYSERSSI